MTISLYFLEVITIVNNLTMVSHLPVSSVNRPSLKKLKGNKNSLKRRFNCTFMQMLIILQ